MSNKQFNFKKYYEFSSEKQLTKEYLEWFIGFVEADGCFTKSGRLHITQKETKILYEIQENMGFGEVLEAETFTSRWMFPVKHGPKCAAKLYYIFNNNIVTRHKLKTFQVWLKYWEKRKDFMDILGSDYNVQKEPNIDLISLNNSWLCGFIDGDGCWDISLYKLKKNQQKKFVIRMCVAAQNDVEWIFNTIKKLKIGRKAPKVGNKNAQWIVTNIDEMEIMINYINKFNHKTWKHKAFNKFCDVRQRIYNKEHLSDEGYEKVLYLKKQINLNS